jgi:endonuclease/exonuclease/phosphatase family metal-dependent hydrolase
MNSTVAVTEPTTDATFRVATLNIWGPGADWPSRRERLRAGLAALSADVVTLQEVLVTADYDQARDIIADDYLLVHQAEREVDGSGVTTMSRWPIGHTFEVDLNVTERTIGFACTSLVTEILAPEPLGRLWVVNHLPDWQPDHEHERELQAVRTAASIEGRLRSTPGHVVVAGDFDAEPSSASLRFWTGRQSLGGMSTCYRSAWESAGRGPAATFVPDNPYSADWDWPYRQIDHILVRCGMHGGPTLVISRCVRIFDEPGETASDHYGLCADLRLPSLREIRL